MADMKKLAEKVDALEAAGICAKGRDAVKALVEELVGEKFKTELILKHGNKYRLECGSYPEYVFITADTGLVALCNTADYGTWCGWVTLAELKTKYGHAIKEIPNV